MVKNVPVELTDGYAKSYMIVVLGLISHICTVHMRMYMIIVHMCDMHVHTSAAGCMHNSLVPRPHTSRKEKGLVNLGKKIAWSTRRNLCVPIRSQL